MLLIAEGGWCKIVTFLIMSRVLLVVTGTKSLPRYPVNWEESLPELT